MAFLVDTSVWVEWLKGQDTPEAGWLGRAIVGDTDIVVPGLVVTEVLRGVASEHEARRLEYLFGRFDPAPSLDDRDYRDAARLYRHCRAKGVTSASTVDCLIAQLAIRHRLGLVTSAGSRPPADQPRSLRRRNVGRESWFRGTIAADQD